MPEQFITPNWHVVLIHFPLGLLGVGVALEWLSYLWPKSAIRTGSRWMMLMGALLAIPTTTLGLYAFRDVVTAQGGVDVPWKQVVQQSHWTDVQWQFMIRHVWLEAIGTGLAVLGAVFWLACSDEARRKIYWPALIIVTAALASMVVGAWYSGESVYRYGTAVAVATPEKTTKELLPVQPPAEPGRSGEAPATAAAATGERHEATNEHHGHEKHEDQEGRHHHELPAWVLKYIPPIQLHLLMVGATLGFAVAAIGLSIRRWSQEYGPLPASRIPPQPTIRAGQPVGQETAAELPGQPVAPAPAVLAPPTILYPIFAARFWVAALVFGLLAAAVGLWMNGDWRLDALIVPLREGAKDLKNNRLFWHVVFGLSIIACTLLLAITTRVTRRAKIWTMLLILLLVIAVALQLWVGVLILYDSPEGAVTGFTK